MVTFEYYPGAAALFIDDLTTRKFTLIKDMKVKTHLKIKISSLAAEARIIRREERKWKGTHPMRQNLHLHRTKDVRYEQRSSLIAYGFLRGRAYRQIEQKNHPDRKKPNWTNIIEIATRFGDLDKRDAAQQIEEWKNVS